jgi:hypothetical protein
VHDMFSGLELDEFRFDGFETIKGPQINLLKLGLEPAGDGSSALEFEIIVADFIVFGGGLGVVHEDFHEGEGLEFEGEHGDFFGEEGFLCLGHWLG